MDEPTGSTMNQTHSREVVVALEQGLHARPADLFAREARRWQSRIEVVGNAQRVDGKSILDLLTLAAEAGTRLVVEATGPDAREAVAAIGSLFDQNFATEAASDAHPETMNPEKQRPGDASGERAAV
jgi:phosphotransferase system HPr (HPr) family protein